MEIPMVVCFELFVRSLFLASIAIQHFSTAELDQPNRSTDDQGSPYFFYQDSAYPRDCLEVSRQCSSNSSGVSAIKPDGYPDIFDAVCDSEGYTVIGRRLDGLIDFDRSWEDYASGFGFPSQEFWLGNQKLSYLNNQKDYQFRIDLVLNDGSTFYVTYDSFRISDAHSNYKLVNLGQYNMTIVSCPANMVSGTCACQQSCGDPATCNPSNCHITRSCLCPSGFLMDDGHCIPQRECGCFIEDNREETVLQEGEVHVFTSCNRKCSCVSGQLSCEEDFQCSPHATCEQGVNGWNCSCNEGYDGDGAECTPTIASDCQDIYNHDPTSPSDVYSITPSWSEDEIQVYCNMEDGGGWTVLQRQDGSGDFYRNWEDYKNGFGAVDSGLWLGNEKIHRMTNHGDYELRIDLRDNGASEYYATYSLFRVDDEASKYTLASVGTYSGNTGFNALSWHVNKKFSTYDQDNDDWSSFDCAEEHQGAWWFGSGGHCPSYMSACRSACPSREGRCQYFPVGSGCANCGNTHLNGRYHSTTRGGNVFWFSLNGYDCGLQYSEMRIRPVQN